MNPNQPPNDYVPDQYAVAPSVSSGKGKWIFFTILFLVLTVAAAGVALYVNSKSKQQINSLNAELSASKSQAANLQEEVDKLNADNANLTYIVIPGIGARMKRSDDLKNVAYYTDVKSNPNQPFTRFTSNEVLGQVMLNPAGPFSSNQCALIDSPLGAITRYKADTVVNGKKVQDQLSDTVKKAGDFYYVYASPQSACSSNANIQDVAVKQQKALSEAFKTIEPIPARNLSN